MITTELVARAICKYGTCKTCDGDCADYRAAERVMKAIEEDKKKETKDEERYEEILRLLHEKSTAANVELCYETKDGETMVVDNQEALAVMNQILEEAYLPFLTRVLVEAGYHRDLEV